MNTTLTIRLSAEQREALRERARRLKQSESELVRELITKETEGFDYGNIGHLVGSVNRRASRHDADAWRKHMRKTNFRR